MNNEANDNLTHHLSQHGFNGHDYGDFKDGWFASWQAATTALLEKLKSEGMMEKGAKAVAAYMSDMSREMGGTSCTAIGETDRGIARAVIEALEKELVG